MWKEVATAFALALLVPPRPSVGQSGCHDDAPDNCNFSCGDTCNWINETGWVSRNSSGWFLALKEQQPTGRLTSRTACSTGGAEHCLTFWYRFTTNFIIYLNVFIGETINSAEKVWKMDHSISGQWEQTKVSFNTTTDFVVVISSQRYRIDFAEDSVFVDAVKYFKSSCDSTPTVATLPTDPTDSLPCVDPTTTTDDTNTDQTASNSSAGSGQTTVSGDVTKSSVSPGATSESSASGATERTSSPTPTSSATRATTSNTTGSISGATIAGAVIASLFVVSALIVGIVLLRRKRLLCFKRDALTAKRPLCLNTPNTASPSTTDTPNTPTYLDILPPLDHTYINQPCAAAHPATPNLRQDSQGYEVPPPKTEEDHYEDVDSAGRKGHDSPMTRANYDSLDFSDADRDKRVYTSLKKDSEYAEIT